MKKKIIITLSLISITVGVSIFALGPSAIPLARWLGFKTIEKPYPRIVHNPNTNLWAVQTGFGRSDQDSYPFAYTRIEYGYPPKDEILYYGQIKVYHVIDLHYDTLVLEDTRSAPAGHEYRYLDSISAAHFWARYAAKASIDSAMAAKKTAEFYHQRYIEDSTLKAEHTYQ